MPDLREPWKRTPALSWRRFGQGQAISKLARKRSESNSLWWGVFFWGGLYSGSFAPRLRPSLCMSQEFLAQVFLAKYSCCFRSRWLSDKFNTWGLWNRRDEIFSRSIKFTEHISLYNGQCSIPRPVSAFEPVLSPSSLVLLYGAMQALRKQSFREPMPAACSEVGAAEFFRFARTP